MSLSRWLRICFFNLLLVSILGILLRYKISFSLPFIDQKHVLHSHSHFAFTGWITQTLMVLMVHYLQKKQLANVFGKYKILLLINLISAYGMLVSFIFQGYGLISIIFSTTTIVVSYIFGYVYWKDLNRIENAGITHNWFKAALLFNAFSSLGAFGLAIMMALKLANVKMYLFFTYYFLHFQYNGWFFFACMGLFFYKANLQPSKNLKTIFWLLAISCVPAYFLSALWAAMHPMIYWMVVIATIAQTMGWIFFIRLLIKNFASIKETLFKKGSWLLVLSVIACSIKITLQLFSVIPILSKLAFGFRPIVIGYLHLVLLGVISLFLLGYIICSQLLKINQLGLTGTGIFVAGIFLNELLLMIQGVGAINNMMVPYINEILVLAALVMFSGLLVLNLSFNKKEHL